MSSSELLFSFRIAGNSELGQSLIRSLDPAVTVRAELGTMFLEDFHQPTKRLVLYFEIAARAPSPNSSQSFVKTIANFVADPNGDPLLFLGESPEAYQILTEIGAKFANVCVILGV